MNSTLELVYALRDIPAFSALAERGYIDTPDGNKVRTVVPTQSGDKCVGGWSYPTDVKRGCYFWMDTKTPTVRYGTPEPLETEFANELTRRGLKY